MNFYANISVPNTIEEIIILSSTINQLTDTTSEWTHASLVKKKEHLLLENKSSLKLI